MSHVPPAYGRAPDAGQSGMDLGSGSETDSEPPPDADAGMDELPMAWELPAPRFGPFDAEEASFQQLEEAWRQRAPAAAGGPHTPHSHVRSTPPQQRAAPRNGTPPVKTEVAAPKGSSKRPTAGGSGSRGNHGRTSSSRGKVQLEVVRLPPGITSAPMSFEDMLQSEDQPARRAVWFDWARHTWAQLKAERAARLPHRKLRMKSNQPWVPPPPPVPTMAAVIATQVHEHRPVQAMDPRAVMAVQPHRAEVAQAFPHLPRVKKERKRQQAHDSLQQQPSQPPPHFASPLHAPPSGGSSRVGRGSPAPVPSRHTPLPLALPVPPPPPPRIPMPVLQEDTLHRDWNTKPLPPVAASVQASSEWQAFASFPPSSLGPALMLWDFLHVFSREMPLDFPLESLTLHAFLSAFLLPSALVPLPADAPGDEEDEVAAATMRGGHGGSPQKRRGGGADSVLRSESSLGPSPMPSETQSRADTPAIPAAGRSETPAPLPAAPAADAEMAPAASEVAPATDSGVPPAAPDSVAASAPSVVKAEVDSDTEMRDADAPVPADSKTDGSAADASAVSSSAAAASAAVPSVPPSLPPLLRPSDLCESHLLNSVLSCLVRCLFSTNKSWSDLQRVVNRLTWAEYLRQWLVAQESSGELKGLKDVSGLLGVDSFYYLAVPKRLQLIETLIEHIFSGQLMRDLMESGVSAHAAAKAAASKAKSAELSSKKQQETDMKPVAETLYALLEQVVSQTGGSANDTTGLNLSVVLNAKNGLHTQGLRMLQEQYDAAREKAQAELAAVEHSHPVRTEPLGMDRYKNRYWALSWVKRKDAPQPPARLFVELCGSSVQGRSASAAPASGWLYYSTESEYKQLLSFLSNWGIREKGLKEALQRVPWTFLHTKDTKVAPATSATAEENATPKGEVKEENGGTPQLAATPAAALAAALAAAPAAAAAAPTIAVQEEPSMPALENPAELATADTAVKMEGIDTTGSAAAVAFGAAPASTPEAALTPAAAPAADAVAPAAPAVVPAPAASAGTTSPPAPPRADPLTYSYATSLDLNLPLLRSSALLLKREREMNMPPMARCSLCQDLTNSRQRHCPTCHRTWDELGENQFLAHCNLCKADGGKNFSPSANAEDVALDEAERTEGLLIDHTLDAVNGYTERRLFHKRVTRAMIITADEHEAGAEEEEVASVADEDEYEPRPQAARASTPPEGEEEGDEMKDTNEDGDEGKEGEADASDGAAAAPAASAAPAAVPRVLRRFKRLTPLSTCLSDVSPTFRVLKAMLFDVEAAIPIHAVKRTGRAADKARLAWIEPLKLTHSLRFMARSLQQLADNLKPEWVRGWLKLEDWQKGLSNVSTEAQLAAALFSFDKALLFDAQEVAAEEARRKAGGMEENRESSGSSAEEEEEEPLTGCMVCGRTDSKKLLTCATCERDVHLSCMRPPIKSVPKGRFDCSSCRRRILRESKRGRTPEEAHQAAAKLAKLHNARQSRAARQRKSGGGKPDGRRRSTTRQLEDPELPNGGVCIQCNEIKDGDDDPLLCDSCNNAYHLQCVQPPLDTLPEGDWFCPPCVSLGVDKPAAATSSRSSGRGRRGGGRGSRGGRGGRRGAAGGRRSKRKVSYEESEQEEESEHEASATGRSTFKTDSEDDDDDEEEEEQEEEEDEEEDEDEEETFKPTRKRKAPAAKSKGRGQSAAAKAKAKAARARAAKRRKRAEEEEEEEEEEDATSSSSSEASAEDEEEAPINYDTDSSSASSSSSGSSSSGSGSSSGSSSDGADDQDVDDGSCTVCFLSREEGRVQCDGCGIVAHRTCVGLSDDAASEWMCATCSTHGSETPCELCPFSSTVAVMAPLTDAKPDALAHYCCINGLPGLRWHADKSAASGAAQLDESKRGLTCSLCSQKRGYCLSCSASGCQQKFHALCALRSKRGYTLTKDGSGAVRSLCPAHASKK